MQLLEVTRQPDLEKNLCATQRQGMLHSKCFASLTSHNYEDDISGLMSNST
jgi:hypothetical protein